MLWQLLGTSAGNPVLPITSVGKLGLHHGTKRSVRGEKSFGKKRTMIVTIFLPLPTSVLSFRAYNLVPHITQAMYREHSDTASSQAGLRILMEIRKVLDAIVLQGLGRPSYHLTDNKSWHLKAKLRCHLPHLQILNQYMYSCCEQTLTNNCPNHKGG